jgi:RimJ/RimL family protein N-acetyltransferase
LKTRTDNFKAIKLYKKLGFEEEGMLKRDILINGTFYDTLCMGMMID